MNTYFKKPVLWDYIISIALCATFFLLNKRCVVHLASKERSLSMASDISNIGLTSAGFILTLLTLLITFKSSSRLTKENYDPNEKLFQLFFVSDLYFNTVNILKNCVKSLIFISILGYSIKTLTPPDLLIYTLYFNIIGLTIIGLTLWRCLFILTKILEMQKE